MYPKSDNSRGFAYVTVAYHVYYDIVKLDGVVKTNKNQGWKGKAKNTEIAI